MGANISPVTDKKLPLDRFTFLMHSYFFILDLRPEQKERILDYVEKFCMTLLHQVLFCPLFTSDEEMDLAIQRRYLSTLEVLPLFIQVFIAMCIL